MHALRKGTAPVANTYKETMNLPKTDFAMRANLPESEPKRLAKWEEEHIYEQVLEKNKDGKPFILHDGPPYANGPIHIGHAFNKILKDFVNKSHAQRGFFTPYVPGWDCHGQPIEHMVEKTLGPDKMAKIDQPTLRRLCREWAEKYVDVQREGFKRLGVNADWEHPYLTFTPNYEAGNVEVFKRMYLDGSVYRGRKPIHWCKRCHTALAEAEIEYSDETSPSIFVKFKMDIMPGMFETAGAAGDAYVLIWTTTPWTLPANTAVSLAPDADYVMLQADGSNMIMARELVEQVAEIAGWESYDLVRGEDGEPVALKGREFTGLTYTCPVRQDLKGTIIYGDHVTLDSGTGAVHTAPGHGQDDYLVALEFDVPLLMPVDDNGVLTDEAGPSRASTLTRRTRSSSNGCANAARWWPKRRSCTATRTAGAATSRSSSAPPTSGSCPWTRTACARTRSRPSRTTSSGFPRGLRTVSDPWWPTVPTGASRASVRGACPSPCSNARSAAPPWRTSRRSTR